jgi:hypothetical protein
MLTHRSLSIKLSSSHWQLALKYIMDIHTADNSSTKVCTVLYKVQHYIFIQISVHFVNYTHPASFHSIQTATLWSVTREQKLQIRGQTKIYEAFAGISSSWGTRTWNIEGKTNGIIDRWIYWIPLCARNALHINWGTQYRLYEAFV